MDGAECVRWIVTQNWRGRPLVNHEVIINVFVSTTMRIGLKIRTELGRTRYRAGARVRDEEVVQGTPRFSAANFTVAVLP